MAIGTILLSTVEGAFVFILVWLAPIASSTIPMLYFFNNWNDVNLFVLEYEFIPRIFGPAFGLAFALANVIFAALMGLAVWMLRGDHTFDQKIAPLIVNYIIMLPWATWSWPLIYNMSHIVTSGALVAASLGTVAFMILCWIFGPWYCGLTATLAVAFNAIIFVIWALPEVGKVSDLLSHPSLSRLSTIVRQRRDDACDFDTRAAFKRMGIKTEGKVGRRVTASPL